MYETPSTTDNAYSSTNGISSTTSNNGNAIVTVILGYSYISEIRLIKLFLEYRCHHRRCNCCYHSTACSGSCSDSHLLVIVSHLTTLKLIISGFFCCACTGGEDIQ